MASGDIPEVVTAAASHRFAAVPGRLHYRGARDPQQSGFPRGVWYTAVPGGLPATPIHTALHPMIGSSLRILSCVVATILPLSAACSEAGGGDAEVEARVDRPDFPGDAAFRLLEQQVAFGPRIPGQEGHRRQLEWMQQWLASRADTLVTQAFSHRATDGELLQLTNLFARFRPELPDRVLLVAHWDTRPRADQSAAAADREKPVPGANDGASGTAILLQLADILARSPPPIGVDILLVDGEDYGPGTEDMFLGARHFAANLPPGYRPLYGVLLDMVGDRGLLLPPEGNSTRLAPEVVQRVWAVARDLGYGDTFVASPGGYVSDDHIPLNEAGIRTIDIIDFDYGPGNQYWHTPLDVPANTSAKSLDIVGEVVTELIYRGG